MTDTPESLLREIIAKAFLGHNQAHNGSNDFDFAEWGDRVCAVLHIAPDPDLCDDEGCPHHGTDHVCNPTPGSIAFATAAFIEGEHDLQQQGDEMFCPKCGKRWGVDEADPGCV